MLLLLLLLLLLRTLNLNAPVNLTQTLPSSRTSPSTALLCGCNSWK